MTDNTTLNPGSGGDVIATDDIGGVKYQRVKVAFGVDGSATDASGINPLPVQIASLIYPASTNNSSTVQLAAGASFTGIIETIQNLQAAQISVRCDQPYSVTINQYRDSGGTKLVSSDVFTRLGGAPLNENVTLPGDYFNLVVKNLGQATTTTFDIGVTFGIMDTVPRTLSNRGGLPVSINDVKGQTLWRTTFASAIASGVDTSFWTLVCTGSGQTVSQSSGNLVLTSGTTVNSETILRSTTAFAGSLISRVQVTLSQRIANNNFFVELVDVIGDGLAATATTTAITVTIPNNPFTAASIGQSVHVGNFAGGLVGTPARLPITGVVGNAVTFGPGTFTATTGTCSLFGWNYHQLIYNGTTATTFTYDCQRRGWASGATTVTINTTASPGHMAVMGTEDGCGFVADQLVASASGVGMQLTPRGSRVANIPEESTNLYLQLRSLNGTVAPASTTSWTVGMASVENYMPLQVAITQVKPQAYDTALMAGLVPGSNLIGDTAVQYRGSSTSGAATPVNVTSLATTAATQWKGSVGRVIAYSLRNNAASARFVKVFNLPSASVVMGTTAATFEVEMVAGERVYLQLEGGIGMGTGISYSTTSARGLTDNTSTGLAVADVTGLVVFV